MDLEKERDAGRGNKKVGEVCSKPPIVAYPDEDLEDVLHKMSTHNIGRLSVVKRENEQEIREIITRADIIRVHERYHEISHV